MPCLSFCLNGILAVIVAEHIVRCGADGASDVGNLIRGPGFGLAAQEGGLVHPVVEYAYWHMICFAVRVYVTVFSTSLVLIRYSISSQP